MPKTLETSTLATTANSNDGDQASNWAEPTRDQQSPGKSAGPAEIIKAITELKTELKGDIGHLRKDFNQMGQEINGKLDGIVTGCRVCLSE